VPVFILEDVHLSLSTGHISLFWVLVRMAGYLHNRSGIYRSSHVVIRPIINCITFKYTCFHIATRRFYFYPFPYTKDQYLGPLQPVRPEQPSQCFVTPYFAAALGVA